MTLYMFYSFFLASVALTVAPGPDNIFVLSQGILRGRRAAIITALGMCSGITVHTTAAALGISAIFYSSAALFNLVKYAGALYLLYLAYKTFRSSSSFSLATSSELGSSALFRRGLVMNLLNPKVALFFLAFLPQFVTPAAGNVPFQMILLGVLFMIQASVIFSLIGWFSGSIGTVLQENPKLSRYFDLLTSGVFAALGLRLALTER
ncbi:MAG: LysE family translocator [Geobacteraceae bacterium]|nr:LysE family translocator [Geobacteraceae bacterium]